MKKNVFLISLLFVINISLKSQIGNHNQLTTTKSSVHKELFLPDTIWRIPAKNDFSNDESEYSFNRMIQSENIAIFWHKEFGDNPATLTNDKMRFDPNDALKECERFYKFYVDTLKMVEKGKSVTDKYKAVLFVINGDGGTAFGGGSGKVGMLWTPAARMNKAPYGALAHELGHSFQYLSRIDAGNGPRGAISEMSAQYMLWQVYPEWMTFENYHLVDYLKGTHYAFLHSYNAYHSPYVFEYWSYKHGQDFFGKLSRNTNTGEDPVMTYKRITNISQEQYNDEMFDAARRFITWDIPRIREVASKYANKHFTTLNAINDNWYTITKEKCPQNYGYNGIRLMLPKSGKSIELQFKGVAGVDSFNNVKIDKAGWRYGFVAYKKDGSTLYSDVYSKPNGKVKFEVPDNTEYLWLVVMGAPKEHWPAASRGRGQTNSPNASVQQEEQWPYHIKLTGTAPYLNTSENK